jgi:hypothetical protein
MALRWSRGLFRFWLVASVLWIAAVGAVTWWRFPLDDFIPDPIASNSEKECPPNWKRDSRGENASRIGLETILKRPNRHSIRLSHIK